MDKIIDVIRNASESLLLSILPEEVALIKDCMSNVIEIMNLKKTFSVKLKGRTTKVEAVCGITLSVKGGEIFGFLGSNGSGQKNCLRFLN